jgi:branched-subunit amino acid aminotransferase/4-amino-4-deoxychorismate lyase
MEPDRVILVEGEAVTEADLACVALVNYGAYTSFRVEGGGVRGLDLHLARLEASAIELFGETPGEARLLDLMRRAVVGRDEAWLRVSLFSPEIRARDAGWHGCPRVMTVASPPPPPLATTVRVQPVRYGRETAHLKHTAGFGLIRARREAVAAGFDDALFVDDEGLISEGTLWNIGFLRGETVVWPQAPMLAGVTQALIERGLASVGLDAVREPVRLDGLDRFDAAFLCNSATPACAVTGIGSTSLPEAPALFERLRQAWRSNPHQAI